MPHNARGGPLGPKVFWGTPTPTYAYMLTKLEEWKFLWDELCP